MAKTLYPSNGDHTPAARAQRETHWRRVGERWKASGQSKSTFCEREGVSDASFHWWLRELARRDRRPTRVRVQKPKAAASAKSTFLPVRLVAPAPKTREPIEVVVMGQVIRVIPDFDPETFRRLVAVLEGQPLACEATMDDPQC
jgi:hypothetical protein